jgi:magnesium transporter
MFAIGRVIPRPTLRKTRRNSLFVTRPRGRYNARAFVAARSASSFWNHRTVSKNHRRKNRRHVFYRRTPPGAEPGTLVADPASQKPVVRVMAYNADEFIERELRTAADFDKLREIVDHYTVTWVNVDGLGDAMVVSRLGQCFGLHPLALEDVLTRHQRSKVEPYGEQVFIVVRMIEGGHNVETDQLAIFLGHKFVLTFQHTHGDCFDPLRQRIRQGHTTLRSAGPDHLAYALIDGVVDSYFPLLEKFGEEIETLEDAIIEDCHADIISRLHEIKSKLLVLRRAIWPLRDALHILIRDPNPLVSDTTRIYLRDCADHTFQIMDLVDTYRELSSDLMGLFHSSLSNRMNEVMQVLTIIATIFIPLTFIVGVYGMNFDAKVSPWNMPELEWYWGYPAVWALMIAIAGSLVYFFSKRDWLPKRKKKPAAAAHGSADSAILDKP